MDELDPEVEQASFTLGASRLKTFASVTLPVLWPSLATGASLTVARALGEFGSLVLIAGNIPFKTEIAPTYVYGRIESGEPFTTEDVKSTNKVALLGKTVVDNLFAGEDPIGKTIRIRKVPFTVVGTLVPKGQNSSGQDQDDMIIMPITTAKKKVMGGGRANNWQQIGQIMVQARDGRNNNAMDEIEGLLRQRHRLQATEDNDFQVRSLEEMAAAQEQATQIMGLLLASIASVSLIVGGSGIMNIMLVSVTERTKEIGLRQAVGAKTNDILSQFLVEAVSLSLLGGCLGIAMGVLASFGISYFAGWNTLVSLPSILAAFFFSALVGVFFGFYPARKAALLDPIEALRYE
jgi:putative ABC transport system permease protein